MPSLVPNYEYDIRLRKASDYATTYAKASVVKKASSDKTADTSSSNLH